MRSRSGHLVSVVLLGVCALVPGLRAQDTIGPIQDSTAFMAPTPELPVLAPLQETPDTAGPEVAGAGAEWTLRVQRHRAGLLDGTTSSTGGGPLLDSLASVIDRAERELADALGSGDPGVSSPLDAELVTLYRARDSLLVVLEDSTRTRLFAFGADGFDAVQRELRFFWLHSHHETVALRSNLGEALDQLRVSPLAWVPSFLKIGLALLIFFWWRGPLVRALQSWRERLLRVRPLRPQNLSIATAIWYFDRVRAPLEWLLLLTAVVIVTPAREVGPIHFTWAVSKWILIGWFAVLLADAVAFRSEDGHPGESPLRRRSLWLLCWWIVAYGLGRQLVRDFFGPGTLYSWVTALLLVLLAVVVAVLVIWWRNEVPERLEELHDPPPLVDTLLAYQRGPRRYLRSLLGGAYLLFDGTRRAIVRVLARSDAGRRTIAYFTRSGLAKQAPPEAGGVEGDALPDPVRKALLDDDTHLIEEVAEDTVPSLVELLDADSGAVAALVGERGGGKTNTLRRVAAKLRAKSLFVACPHGTFDHLAEAIAVQLGLPGDTEPSTLAGALGSAGVRVVIVDDVHRLARPVIGGMVEIERFRGLIREANDVSWLFSVDAAAWEYIRRFRVTEPVHHHVVQLEKWSEETIGQLVDARTKAAGLEPDFGQLILPRRFEYDAHPSASSRNMAGFYRILWDEAAGNPEVALRMWAHSLVITPSGATAVRLAPPPRAGDLEGQSPNTFFVLRTLLRLESASPNDVASCLPIPLEEVEDTLHFLRTKGVLEEREGRLSVSWRWDRAVRRALSRRNMTA